MQSEASAHESTAAFLYHFGDKYRYVNAQNDTRKIERPIGKLVVRESYIEYSHGYLREDAQQKNLEGVISERRKQPGCHGCQIESQRYREEYTREIQ